MKTKRGWRPREETLATAEFKRAHAKALESRKKKTCKRGHDLRKPEHVHAGTLLRTEGWWVRDKDHGLQFKATAMKTVPPTRVAVWHRALES